MSGERFKKSFLAAPRAGTSRRLKPTATSEQALHPDLDLALTFRLGVNPQGAVGVAPGIEVAQDRADDEAKVAGRWRTWRWCPCLLGRTTGCPTIFPTNQTNTVTSTGRFTAKPCRCIFIRSIS